MLSSDVAKIYQVETKRINEVIKRNINRFPETFCFQLTNDELNDLTSRSQIVTMNNEVNSLRSQFATLNKSNNLRGLHYKYLPYVLTEQGIMMLSGLLKSDIAVQVNVQIIEAFCLMKKYFNDDALVLNHEKRIQKLEKVFNNYLVETKCNKIFFEGQIYDSYSILLEIFDKSSNEIIIIDNYFSKDLLDILRELEKKIIIVSKNFDNELIKKYNSQYENIVFLNNNSFHDRFIIIDRKIVYSCGASFKDLGKKCFAINEFNDKEYLNKILSIIDV